MTTKYQCKRCDNIITIKVPNCPSCSSSDGFERIDALKTTQQIGKREGALQEIISKGVKAALAEKGA